MDNEKEEGITTLHAIGLQMAIRAGVEALRKRYDLPSGAESVFKSAFTATLEEVMRTNTFTVEVSSLEEANEMLKDIKKSGYRVKSNIDSLDNKGKKEDDSDTNIGFRHKE